MIEDITREVLARVKPSAKDTDHLHALARGIIVRLNAKAAEMGLDVYAIHVGSTARDTWLRGKKDIDIFLMFPPDTPREKLEESGLELAKSLCCEYQERYAEHPYIKSCYGGIDVDLVPCYRVPDAAHIQSAVDRSPFHNAYVQAHIDGLSDEARLLKQFMHGTGVYGSELKTQGFSGYLSELLIIRYGSFMEAVRAGANFRRGTVIDIEGHMDKTVKHPEPLIVIDPVDPRRNVAAALSPQKFYEYIDACRDFLAKPSIGFFFPPEPEPMDEPGLLRALDARGTLLLAVAFRTPDIVEDTLYPQLRKGAESVAGMLERHEFRVFERGVWSGGGWSALVFELLVWRLPDIERHYGPPVEQREHAGRFKQKYPDAYIDEYRYAVNLPRGHTTAEGLISDCLTECGLGKNVAASIKSEFVLLTGASLLSLGPGMGTFLRTFLR
ncbi:MAG: CCA-adding enzyme [Methanocella sp. PtaU1.Bin125]|nr:MAG: CCA-adding enzyme [Methanocella sp. PtaU1.Bin125]